MRAAPGNFFAGSLDDAAAWNRALSWTEIQQVARGAIPPTGPLVAPAIYVQPADVISYRFVANNTASFTVLASGTGPLAYQWRKDSLDLPSSANPSARSNVLSLASLTPSDVGAYSVVVSGSAGSITSRVAQLVLSDAPFRLDLGLTNSPNAQPGFVEMTLANSGASFSGVKVTVSPLGGIALSDRNRIAGAMVANNPPLLTQAQIYNDFVFGNNNATVGTGLSILLENLLPNTPFGLTVWSFDPQSAGDRVSDWTETSSGVPVTIVTNYVFNGSVLPVADYDYTFGALVDLLTSRHAAA